MAVRPIRIYPDPVLKQVAAPIETLDDAEIASEMLPGRSAKRFEIRGNPSPLVALPISVGGDVIVDIVLVVWLED